MSKSVRRHGMMAVMLGTALSIVPSASAATFAEDSAVRDLSRYCVACWRNAGVPVDRWSDCTQETLCELLGRVPLEEWSTVLTGSEEKRRELIRVIDLVKKRFQREKKWTPLEDDQVRDPGASENGEAGHDREAVRSAAKSLLTARQRLILERSAEGFAVREIASELKMPTSRVSDEKYKAIRKLHDHFVARV